MSASADGRLQSALRDLSAALNGTGARWMVIGGIAVIARGVRRFTGDIDAAVRGDDIAAGTLIAALKKKRIVPRIADAAQFASENLVLLLRHQSSGVDFDVSFAWTAFEHEAIAAATVAAFGTVSAPMARPEDLVVFKAVAGRGRDLDDMTALLALYPKLDLVRIRDRVRGLATLADAPEISVQLEKAIAASVRRPVRAATRTSESERAKTTHQKAKPRTRERRAGSKTRKKTTPRSRR